MNENNKEIKGWFPPEQAEALKSLIAEHQIKTVLEIGSFLGKSTVFFASHVDAVICVDPFKAWTDKERPNPDTSIQGEDFYDKFVENMKDAGVWDKILSFRGTSEEFFKAETPLKNGGFELIYIDGLHDCEAVRTDILGSLEFNPRIICGDDYDENWLGVKKAVDEAFGDRVKIKGRLWYVIL